MNLAGSVVAAVLFVGLIAGAVLGLELSTDTEKLDNIAFWRGVFGAGFSQGRFGRSWTPMVEVLGSVPFGEDAGVRWTLVPQLQASLNTRQHVLANLGFRVPLTEPDRRDTQLVFYVLWDTGSTAAFSTAGRGLTRWVGRASLRLN